MSAAEQIAVVLYVLGAAHFFAILREEEWSSRSGAETVGRAVTSLVWPVVAFMVIAANVYDWWKGGRV